MVDMQRSAFEVYHLNLTNPQLGDGVIFNNVVFGNNVRVWHYTVIQDGTTIGDNTVIGSFCDIGKNVSIGKDCLIQAHVTISNLCKIGDRVFIGPNTSLLNHKHPPRQGTLEPVTVCDEAVIGGGVTVLPRVTIGWHAMIGAGAVVTRDVEANSVMVGNPARTLKVNEGGFDVERGESRE